MENVSREEEIQKMSSNVLQPHKDSFTPLAITTLLSSLWGFIRFLPFTSSGIEKNTNAVPLPILPTLHLIKDWIFFFFLEFLVFFGSERVELNKKMKREFVCFDQSCGVGDEAGAKLKFHTLLKEYLQLQKEFVSRKRKLHAAKQKRETITAEVRFLRRKHKYLLKSQALRIGKDTLHLPNSYIKNKALKVERNHSGPAEVVSEDKILGLKPEKNKIYNRAVGRGRSLGLIKSL